MPLLQVVIALIVVGVLALAGEPLHPHGRLHQVDPERRCRHCRCDMAAERLWADAVSLEHSHWQDITDTDDESAARRKPGRRNVRAMNERTPDAGYGMQASIEEHNRK